jgi:hypothetical protein
MEHRPSAQGCGLHFCSAHLNGEQKCDRCAAGKAPYKAKADHPGWDMWKLTHESWAAWRATNPEAVARLYMRHPTTPVAGPAEHGKNGGA